MVLDVLRLLAKGSDAAKEAGKKLLSGMPLAGWVFFVCPRDAPSQNSAID